MEISVTMCHVSRTDCQSAFMYGISRQGKLCERFTLSIGMGCKTNRYGNGCWDFRSSNRSIYNLLHTLLSMDGT